MRPILFSLTWLLLVSFQSPLILSITELPLSPPTAEDPLWSYQGKEVQIRGFWYPVNDEQGILMPSPNLKSCCVAHAAQNGPSVDVRGSIPSTPAQQAVTLAGIFQMESSTDRKKLLFRLVQSHRVDEGTFSVLRLIGVLSSAGLIGYGFYRYRRA